MARAKVDLITGFLGAGKTTFIKKYANYLVQSGMKIGILENDFGAVNIDMLLLQDIMSENCDLEMVSGACDKDCHRRRFKTKLISMGMRGFDRVLIEPSGIYDVDEFFDVLREEPLDNWFEIGNVITIADAGLEDELSDESDYLLASQAASAGAIILSRCQEVGAEDIAHTKAHLTKALEKFHCCRDSQPIVIAKDWGALTDEDFAQIASCGYEPDSHEKLWFDQDSAYSSLYFMNKHVPVGGLEKLAASLMSDPACGRIFRVKGFASSGDEWFELNATHREITVRPIERGQEIIIVIGEGLNKEAIEGYFG